ncbi:MAG: DUF5602 domain-containing protein [Armatimonadaceae bacterium]
MPLGFRFGAGAVFCGAVGLLIIGCGSGPGTIASRNYLRSAEVLVGGGSALSYTRVNQAGRPIEMGVRLSSDAIRNPPNGIQEVPLPVMVRERGLPFDHISLDWKPAGNDPAAIYNASHWEVHFYLMTPAERQQITAQGPDLARVEAPPPAEAIPAGYLPTPGGVPTQGAHWFNPTAPEHSGAGFSHTLLYGFYNGRMVFLEPRVTQSMAQSVTDVSQPIPQPQVYPKPGLYPTTYRVRREANGDISILLENLVQRP